MKYLKILVSITTLISSTALLVFAQHDLSAQNPFGVFESALFKDTFFANKQAQSVKKAPNSDDLSIELLFRMILQFEKEANRQDLKGNHTLANAFRNFFRRKARLDEAQTVKLKEMAGNFAVDVKASLSTLTRAKNY